MSLCSGECLLSLPYFSRNSLKFLFISGFPSPPECLFVCCFRMAMFALIKDIVPIACEAFVDYRLEGMFLTRLEVDAIRNQSSVMFLFFTLSPSHPHAHNTHEELHRSFFYPFFLCNTVPLSFRLASKPRFCLDILFHLLSRLLLHSIGNL